MLSDSNINIKNEYGQNLLHEAIANNKNDLAMHFIKMGIEVNCVDKKGQTPLHYAAMYKNAEINKAILDNGGNPNIHDKFGNNSLWTAIMNAKNDYTMLRLLVSAGADIHAKNNSGKSPLDLAIEIGVKEIVSILTVKP